MLFLFDTDGTLLMPTSPAHSQALCEAARQVFGVYVASLGLEQTAGMLDSVIARRMLHHAGVPQNVTNAGLPAFFDVAADAYERLAPPDLRPYRTPYAQQALDHLVEADVALGVVTGGMRRIALSKLRAAGLASYFPVGAFGDEADARDELPRLALARMEQRCGRACPPDTVYVVGDTPADIACGAACGLRTIGVATGPIHSLQELRAAGADYTFTDLRGILLTNVFTATPG